MSDCNLLHYGMVCYVTQSLSCNSTYKPWILSDAAQGVQKLPNEPALKCLEFLLKVSNFAQDLHCNVL